MDTTKFRSLLQTPTIVTWTNDEPDMSLLHVQGYNLRIARPPITHRQFIDDLPQARRVQVTKLALSNANDGYDSGLHIPGNGDALSRCTLLAFLRALPNVTAIELADIKWVACEREGEAGHRCERMRTYPKVHTLIIDRVDMREPYDADPMRIVSLTPCVKLFKMGRMAMPPLSLLPRGPLPRLPSTIERFSVVFPPYEAPFPANASSVSRLPNYPSVKSLELRRVDIISGAVPIVNDLLVASADHLEEVMLIMTPLAVEENGSPYGELALSSCERLLQFSIVLYIPEDHAPLRTPICAYLSSILGCLPSTVTHIRISFAFESGIWYQDSCAVAALRRMPWGKVRQHLRKLPLEALLIDGPIDVAAFVEANLQEFAAQGKVAFHEISLMY